MYKVCFQQKKNNNDLLYAFIVAVIIWLISYGYINHQNTVPNQNLNQQNIPTYKLIKELSESPKSFTLMNKGGGLVMPLGNNPLPEVFIDNF